MVTQRLGDLVAVGLGKEATFGTNVVAAKWLPVRGVKPAIMPNVVDIPLMQNSRVAISEAVAGIQHNTVSIEAPMFPDAGMDFFVGAIGVEDSTTAASLSGTTDTISAGNPVAVGDLTIKVTSGNFTNNDIVQVGTTGHKEIRKVTGKSGAGDPFTYTVDQAFNYAHVAGIVCTKTIATSFTHAIVPSNTLPSWSLETNLNSADLQWYGSVISKMDLKMVPNADVQATYAFDTQRQRIPTPGTASWPSDTAYGPTSIGITLDGNSDLTPSNISLSLDNGVKVIDSLQGQNYPLAVIPITRKVGVKTTLWLQTLASGFSAFDYYSGLTAVSTHAIVMTLTQGALSCVITIPQAVLKSYPPNVRRGEVVTLDLDWDATLQGAPSGNDLTASIVNAVYLPY